MKRVIKMKDYKTMGKLFLLAFVISYLHNSLLAQPRLNINEPQPSRQVHLDFHTSEYIPGIGEKFDKVQFQNALRTGHVNQINIFAKCHHSWCYYPSKVGDVHPNLKFDLLGAEIDACHEIGVVCPIYFSVGRSEHDADMHPEWCARKSDGSFISYDFNTKPTDDKPFGGWRGMCPTAGGPYHELIKKQVQEICEKYPVDGFWFDIYGQICYCENCFKRMKNEGIDIHNRDEVIKSTTLAYKRHMKELRDLIEKYHPKATVFFNNTTHVGNNPKFVYRIFDMNTHQELEDLPTVWGGYDKLPLGAKFHLGEGYAVVAMSGKFHKAWGEFGGFKHPDAIKYEAAAMISNGVSCNFGDQLHPSGEMDIETYRNIGEAYKYVEKIEKYGLGGIPYSKTGIWLTLNNAADLGVVNMLLQTHNDFVVANENNLDKLDAVIIPSHPTLDEIQAKKINDWVKKGGKLIVFGKGGLDKSGSKFLLDVGADYLGESGYQFDYTVVKKEIGENIVTTPFLNYESGLLISATSGNVLANIREPYFNRTYEHFSSHRETPYQLEDSKYPAIIKNGNVILFAHHLDQLYYKHGMRIHRDLVNNAIDLLNDSPVLKVNNLPSCGRVSFLKQAMENRYVAHLLYAPALQRGEVQVIEDLLPVPGIEIEVIVPEKVKNVVQVPDNKKLSFKRDGNVVKIRVPTFTMHTAIVLEY